MGTPCLFLMALDLFLALLVATTLGEYVFPRETDKFCLWHLLYLCVYSQNLKTSPSVIREYLPGNFQEICLEMLHVYSMYPNTRLGAGLTYPQKLGGLKRG